MGHPTHCKVVESCADDKIRCADGTCQNNLADCSLTICPINVFVRCLDGTCVSNPEECPRLKSLKCPSDKPIKCLNGECANKFLDCLGEDEEVKTGKNTNRLLAEAKVDAGCSSVSPVRCSNGGCVKSSELCEVITGCGITKPYRCQNGSCNLNKAECEKVDKSLTACAAGLSRCVDGICRSKCLPHSGCPANKPLTCANNYCAANESECKLTYKCDDKTKVRCFDGSCKAKVGDCPKIMTLAAADRISVTSSAYKDATFDFIQNGKSSVKLGSLTVPAAALNLPIGSKTPQTFDQELKDKVLIVSAFPDSTLRSGAIFKTENNDKLKAVLKGTTGDLNFYNAVRSTVVKFAAKDRTADVNYRHALTLTLATQKYASTEDADYCLAILTNSKFTCVSRPSAAVTLTTVSKLTFKVAKDGVYAVVFSPQAKSAAATGSTTNGAGTSTGNKNTNIATKTTDNDCGYWCENKGLGIFLILFGIILITLLVISLVVNGLLKKRYTDAVQELGHYKNGDVESNNAKGDSESSAFAKQLADKDSQIDRIRQRENVLEQEVQELRARVTELVSEKEAAAE